MKKINNFLRKYLSNIAIGIGIIGICAHCIIAFTNLKSLSAFSIIYFHDPFRKILSNFKIYSNINFLSILFLIMLIIGGFLYKKSEGKDKRLLKFGFSIIAVNSSITIILSLLRYLSFRGSTHVSSNSMIPSLSIFDFIYPIIAAIPLAYVGYYLTKYLLKDQELDYKFEELDNGQIQLSFDVVPKNIRFSHLIFDFFIMLLILWPFINYLTHILGSKFLSTSSSQLINDRFYLSVIIGFMTIFYYLIFEGIFQATPIKFLTGTRVVDGLNMKIAKFNKILVRTFCRRIPFESLSFFGRSGWHDSFSNTEVIFEKRESRVKFKNWVWILLLVLAYFFVITFSLVKNNIIKNKRTNLISSATAYQNEATLANLNKGDLLLLKEVNGKSTEDQSIIIVSNTTKTDVSGVRYSLNHQYRFNRLKYIKKGIDNFWKKRDTVLINKDDINNAYLSRKTSKESLNLGNEKYTLLGIEDMDNPIIQSNSSSGQFTNKLKTTRHLVNHDLCLMEVLNIEVIEGQVEWKVDFPMKIDFNRTEKIGNFRLISAGKSNTNSISRMKVRYYGKEHYFLVFKHDSTILFAKEKLNN